MNKVVRPAISLFAVLLIVAALPLLVVGCGGEDADNGGDSGSNAQSAADNVGVAETKVEVVMEDTQYVPKEITVKTGTTVIWVNADPVDHTVTANDGKFDSGDLGEGDTFTYTFTKPGVYEYGCLLHPPDMKGTVTVE